MSRFFKRAKLAFLVALFFVIGVVAAFARDGAIGDSIGLGTGRALHVATFARERMSSCWILRHKMPSGYFDHLVVSAGVNDAPGRCVWAIAARLHAGVVVWIRPINSAGPTIDQVAKKYGFHVITYRVGRDHLHPASYAAVAKTVRLVWREGSSSAR